MSDLKLSVEQIKMCKHTLGLDYRKFSFRNYYNTGRNSDPALDELVTSGLMSRRETSKEMGGFYYHLTDEGIKSMKEIFGDFRVVHD